jgi:uncharacterized membrane protein
MSINTDSNYRAGSDTVERHDRLSTETKASTKTTEFFVFLAAVAAVVITAFLVGQDENTGIDPFSALDALRYITFLSIGYMVARGLAKSGSRENYTN